MLEGTYARLIVPLHLKMRFSALQIFPLMVHATRPSRLNDMPAVANAFWLGKNVDALTFFGTILTRTDKEASVINNRYNSLKNHEMIHLRQAQSCGDSWLRFYFLYLWYSFVILLKTRNFNKAYLLNPFEMEAYRNMNNLDYVKSGDAVEGWRRYRKMSIEERAKEYTILSTAST